MAHTIALLRYFYDRSENVKVADATAFTATAEISQRVFEGTV
jgi:hypothetical protein